MAESSRTLSATVVITTRNRKRSLRTALQSVLIQTANPEILVIDDCSGDGTSEMVRAEFPSVKLDRSEKALGLIVQRNRGAQLASGEIIFSIDDDAAFSSPRVVEQTLAEFDHPCIGAVEIPFINVNQEKSPERRGKSDKSTNGVLCGYAYIGTAHALRR